jgi:hypothetical protein
MSYCIRRNTRPSHILYSTSVASLKTESMRREPSRRRDLRRPRTCSAAAANQGYRRFSDLFACISRKANKVVISVVYVILQKNTLEVSTEVALSIDVKEVGWRSESRMTEAD